MSDFATYRACCWLCCFCLLTAHASSCFFFKPVHDGPAIYKNFVFGAWLIEVSKHKKTGQFTHCFALSRKRIAKFCGWKRCFAGLLGKRSRTIKNSV
ncbi:hypothetical protein ADUPG1_002779, partial [Aduncisulcus paluster]